MEAHTTHYTKRRFSIRIAWLLAGLVICAQAAQANDIRARYIKPNAPSVAMERSMNETISAHFGGIRLRKLILYLAPRGWRVRFDVAANKLRRRMVFHAETTRRRAFDEILSELDMKGVFYPSKRLLLIYDRERQ